MIVDALLAIGAFMVNDQILLLYDVLPTIRHTMTPFVD